MIPNNIFKKSTYVLLLFTLIFNKSFGQKLSDKFDYKISYQLTFKIDTTNIEESKKEVMVLYIGDNLSKFSSRAKTVENPIIVKGNTASTSRAALTNFHYEIIKDRSLNSVYYTKKVPKMNDQFYYVENSNLFDWKIHPETKSIKEFKVQKATTNYSGREYIAWFTSEIPIADGPYKFNGLPGLILEIADIESHYVFEFVGLEKLTPSPKFTINLNDYLKTEKQELLEIWYRYRRDPIGYANNPNVRISAENHKKLIESFTEMLSKENNPIELN